MVRDIQASTGQVGGVAISAALFQSVLNVELHKRIHGDDAESVGSPAIDRNLVLTELL